MASAPDSVDWLEYARRCEAPDVMSRWLLETTARLIGDKLGAHLTAVVLQAPLPLPSDHTRDARADMFQVNFHAAQVRAIGSALTAAAGDDETARKIGVGRLRHITIAWSEHEQAMDNEGCEPSQAQQRGDDV